MLAGCENVVIEALNPDDLLQWVVDSSPFHQIHHFQIIEHSKGQACRPNIATKSLFLPPQKKIPLGDRDRT